nr:MAG TPA: hypothetical protein [Caudoviricetes sp.]
MKLEFRTKNTAYGYAHYLCIDTDAKVVTTTPTHWVSIDVPIITKSDLGALKAKAIEDGYKVV